MPYRFAQAMVLARNSWRWWPAGPPAGGLEDQSAALREQILAGFGLELAPYRVRALDQWRVGLALADRLAGDARIPVGRTVDVRR